MPTDGGKREAGSGKREAQGGEARPDAGWERLGLLFDTPLPLLARLEATESSRLVDVDQGVERPAKFHFVVVTYPLRLGSIDHSDSAQEFWRR